MFFQLHGEYVIGYKTLSAADLGIGKNTHQTHIGLSEYVLSFLPDRDKISEDSILIYEDKFYYIDAYFDRIENQDGSFRSPKIRVGDRGCVSVVSTIREIAKSHSSSIAWFLLWFGLKNEKIVFFLFNNRSDDYINIENAGLKLNNKGARAIDNGDPLFDVLLSYLEKKINSNGIEILKELEVVSQTQDLRHDKRFKKYDIDRANEKFREIGKNGERLVAEYLNKKMRSGQIVSFIWHNEDAESGLPYDFTVQDIRASVFNIDVKTTGYGFNQKMIFSTQEIDFIANTNCKYSIYRVYKNDSDDYFLRICDDCKDLSGIIWARTAIYAGELNALKVELRTAKLAIPPDTPLLKFKPEVLIASP